MFELLPLTTRNTRCESSAHGLVDRLPSWLTSRLVPVYVTNRFVMNMFFLRMCAQSLHCHHTDCGDGCHTHNEKQITLHLLDCAELGGIWDEDLCHPSSQNFLPNLVVPFFCGADLCDIFNKGYRKTHLKKTRSANQKNTNF